jgi:hypothetical protein
MMDMDTTINGLAHELWAMAQGVAPIEDVVVTMMTELHAFAAAAVATERERCAAVARRWGETHADGETVNARNAASKIARGIEGPNVAIKRLP